MAALATSTWPAGVPQALDLGLGPARAATSRSWPTRRPASGHLEDLLGQLAQASMRPRSTSARASGRAMSARMAPAATSSSAKNVALGAGQDAVDHGRGHQVPGDGLEVLGQLDPAEGPARSAPARGGGPARPAAGAAGGGGAARRSGSWPPGPPAPQRADREGQQVAGGGVGPVQVLDDQQQRASSDRRTSSDSTRRTAAPARSRHPGPPALAAGRLGQSRPRLGTAAVSRAATSASPGRVPRSRKASTNGT